MQIVSLVPSQTELIHDLNLNKELVGVTNFCLHPEHLRTEKTIIGGTKNVNVEKVKKLQPDFICANKEENTKATVEELSKEFDVHLADFHSIEGALDLILEYGKLFNRNLEARQLHQEITQLIAQTQAELKKTSPLKVAYLIWKDPIMVAGNNTFINSMLKLFKLDNVFSHLERYPVIDKNDLQESDLVLFSSEPYPFNKKNIKEINLANTAYQIVNGEFFSWYGSRMKKAIPFLLEWRKGLT
ncbi:MAG: helical backbone metal receptor [Psychroflexus maritimus]